MSSSYSPAEFESYIASENLRDDERYLYRNVPDNRDRSMISRSPSDECNQRDVACSPSIPSVVMGEGDHPSPTAVVPCSSPSQAPDQFSQLLDAIQQIDSQNQARIAALDSKIDQILIALQPRADQDEHDISTLVFKIDEIQTAQVSLARRLRHSIRKGFQANRAHSAEKERDEAKTRDQREQFDTWKSTLEIRGDMLDMRRMMSAMHEIAVRLQQDRKDLTAGVQSSGDLTRSMMNKLETFVAEMRPRLSMRRTQRMLNEMYHLLSTQRLRSGNVGSATSMGEAVDAKRASYDTECSVRESSESSDDSSLASDHTARQSSTAKPANTETRPDNKQKASIFKKSKKPRAFKN